jgi:hypothetical protein
VRGDFGERDGFVAAINLTHSVSHVIEAEIYMKDIYQNVKCFQLKVHSSG